MALSAVNYEEPKPSGKEPRRRQVVWIDDELPAGGHVDGEEA